MKKLFQIFVVPALFISNFLSDSIIRISAEETETIISGKQYTFDEKSHYIVTDELTPITISGQSSDDSQLIIKGDTTPLVDINEIPSYGVSSGNVSFSYSPGLFSKETQEDKWHLTEDKTKEIAGNKISKKIGKGAIVVQTSQDGNEWVTDISISNVLNNTQKVEDFYSTKNIQLLGGCFYRVIVAYELTRKTGEDKKLFIKTEQFESKKIAEIYDFYLHDSKSSQNITQSSISMTLGNKNRTEKNDGYYGSKPIDIKDPHYGWDLGHFFVSGFTDDTQGKNGTPVFLKNVGDQVTLWFNLEQDIDKLNNNDHLIRAY